jgi:hypothetical protein
MSGGYTATPPTSLQGRYRNNFFTKMSLLRRHTQNRASRQTESSATSTGKLPSVKNKVNKGYEGWLVCTEILTAINCFREKCAIAEVPNSQFYCTADPNSFK